MKRKELLGLAEDLIKSFDPAKTTIDSHADEFLRDRVPEEAHRQLLHEILYGCYRYRALLKSLLSHFFQVHAGSVNRKEHYTTLLVISYMSMFMLEQGMKQFMAFVNASNANVMYIFLNFLFDRKNLEGPIAQQWKTVLDDDFVDGKLIKTMESFDEPMKEFLQQLHVKAFGPSQSASPSSSDVVEEKKATTIPVAFNLTQPKPRKAVEPERIESRIKAKPVPSTLNKVTLADISKQQEERKQKVKEEVAKKYESTGEFTFESTASSNLEKIRQEVEAEREAHLQFDFKARPPPSWLFKETPVTENSEVRLNATAILREDALIKKKQAKEAEILKAYEVGLRNPFEFYEWQHKMQQQDAAEVRDKIEQRRLEMVQAQENAIEAAHRARMENQSVANQMKEMARERDVMRKEGEDQLVDKYRQVMTEVKQHREIAPREAEDRIQQEKARQHNALKEMLEEARKKKLEQDAIELAQREELIRQIRALEKERPEYAPVFDPTECPHLGLLDEMSLAELRERLKVVKVEQQKWEADRREQIQTFRQQKDMELEQKASSISRLRVVKAKTAAENRRKKKAMLADRRRQEEENHRKGVLKLNEKIQAQRQQREKDAARLKQEAEEIAKKRGLLGAAKTMLEATHFEQLKCAAEREVKARQTSSKQAAITYEFVRKREKSLRDEYARKIKGEKQAEDQTKLASLTKDRESCLMRLKEEDEMVKLMVQHERNRYQHAKDVLRNRNMYATTQTDALIQQARETVGVKPPTIPIEPFTSPRRREGAQGNQVEELEQMCADIVPLSIFNFQSNL